ncbi:cytochrome B [Wenzhouxiangella sp. XN79A]|uniref:cytochrome b/b6 domain-containing protein n=1 Tax=Wenzhouxiangella sp. XN79A TaxID=2724193 RepID=UPI00144A90B0|nr:cytochrome b/b6 domain-containing protein [Wenzhouxiangella sp. XN79A]NKI35190.1 cytochrome B [Wenzhouxiangella sp. XN79A]
MTPTTPERRSEPSRSGTWDPMVRIGHWLLAAAFVTAWIAGDEYQQVHVLAGYTIAVILLVRFAWGLFGPHNARFSQFVRGPAAVVRYLESLVRGEPEAHRGHNPAGGWMVVLLLVALSVQVGSGMTLYALDEGKGPLAAWLAAETPSDAVADSVAGARGSAGTNEREDDEHEGHDDEEGALEEAVEDIHEFGADLLLLLIALHVAGVLVSSLLHRENFVRGMITGRRSGQ